MFSSFYYPGVLKKPWLYVALTLTDIQSHIFLLKLCKKKMYLKSEKIMDKLRRYFA